MRICSFIKTSTLQLSITLTVVLSIPSLTYAFGKEGGGGGNTINLSINETKFRLENIKQNLRIAIHRAKFWLEPDHKSTYIPGQPLNENNSTYNIGLEILTHPSFLEMVNKMTINVIEDDCKDLQGVSEDGSANLTNISICLSAKRLSKIPVSSFNSETLALAMHEVLHLMGEDEETAQLIQKFAIWRKNSLLNTYLSDYKDLVYRALAAQSNLQNIDYFIKVKKEFSACYDIGSTVEKVNSIFPWSSDELHNLLPSNNPLSLDGNKSFVDAMIDLEQLQNNCRSPNSFSATTSKQLKTSTTIIKKGLEDFVDFVINYDSPDKRLRNEFHKN